MRCQLNDENAKSRLSSTAHRASAMTASHTHTEGSPLRALAGLSDCVVAGSLRCVTVYSSSHVLDYVLEYVTSTCWFGFFGRVMYYVLRLKSHSIQ